MLEIDAAVVAAAEKIARARGEAIDAVISELARRGLAGERQAGRFQLAAFPVFEVPADAPALTIQTVRAIIDYEGLPARR